MLTDGANGQFEQAGDQSALLEAMVAQDRLGRRSTNMPLMGEVRGEMHGADDEAALLRAISRCAAILFDVPRITFSCGTRKPECCGVAHPKTCCARSSSIPDGAANAVNRHGGAAVSHSLDAEIPAGVVDRQLSRLWETKEHCACCCRSPIAHWACWPWGFRANNYHVCKPAPAYYGYSWSLRLPNSNDCDSAK